MSGHKHATVTISEEEYRRLHQADMKRRFQERSKKAKPSAQPTDLTPALREMENRQHQLERALTELSRMDQDVNAMGMEMVQEILNQNAACYESLASRIEHSAAESDASLGQLSQHFAQEMQRNRHEYQLHLQSLMQRFDSYEQREQSKAQMASAWLKQSAALADFIQGQFDHERFLPGQLSRILSSLNFAQSNLRGGLFESSIQTSQQAFLQLSELHFELEQRTLEWQREYVRAENALTQCIAELEMNESVHAIGLEGEQLPAQVDLTYWSNGMYQELLDKCRRLQGLLSEEKRSISTEELTKTHTELIPVVMEKFEAILYVARLNALNSQLRMNIAERALQALELHGFQLSESGYSRQDMRDAFKATLENPDGSRVMIEVLPAENSKQELTNELVVITDHPHLRTEHEARLQWHELCRTLAEYELQVSRPEIRTSPFPTTQLVEPAPAFNKPVRSKRHHHV